MNKEIENGVQSVKKFAAESYRFLEVCEKPDVAGKKYFNYLEFRKIAQSCALGFAIMGGIGYVVKLLFIPINNIILS
jgi:protein transport protein SEC61 subunit gamma-like protein